MTGTRRDSAINWRQGVFEASLIFLGVAVALAGQSWWDYRQDRELEKRYIEGLLTEAWETERALISHLERRAGYQASAVRLLGLLGTPDGIDRPDSIVAATTRLGWAPSYRPPRATLDDMLGAGGLSVIRSTSLRVQLARYAQAIERNLAMESRLFDHYERVLEPFYLSEEWSFLDGGPRGREDPQLPRSRWAIEPDDFVVSRAFEKMVSSHLWSHRDAIQANEGLLRTVRALTEELERDVAP